MWYKHFRKSSWRLRLWRTQNLKMKYNNLSMASNFYMTYPKLALFKLMRNDGTVRLATSIAMFILIGFWQYYNETRYGVSNRKK